MNAVPPFRRLAHGAATFSAGTLPWRAALSGPIDEWCPSGRSRKQVEDLSLIADERFQRLLPFLQKTVAVVDIGSSTAKLVILGPSQFQVAKYPLKLGESLGMTRDLATGKGIITAKAHETLVSALLQIRAKLLAAGVPAEQLRAVATAGLRDAVNGKALVDQAHDLGIPLTIINGTEEARHAYQSVLRSVSLQPWEGALVIEIGGGSTELAFGRGQTELEEPSTATLEVGTDRIHLQDPFDGKQVELGKWKARFAFAKALSQKPENVLMALQQTALTRRVFAEPTTLYQILRDLYQAKTGVDFFQTGLSHEVIRYYLTPQGLQEIKANLQAYQGLPPSIRHKGTEYCFTALPGELLILNEIFEELHLQKLEFGASGGLKMGYLLEIAAMQQPKTFSLAGNRSPFADSPAHQAG